MDSVFGGSAAQRRRGILSPVPAKSFQKSFQIHTPTGFVIVNGEQVTRFEFVTKGDNWDVTLYMVDGWTYTVSANQWTKRFAPEVLGIEPEEKKQ
jgi:hypothetical protein